ncbi:hypothetical protein [Duganella qianjiadongensis]
MVNGGQTCMTIFKTEPFRKTGRLHYLRKWIYEKI